MVIWTGRKIVKHQKKIARDITGMPLGRTEVLVVPNDAPSRELSHGQGPRLVRLHGSSKVRIYM